MGLYGVGTACAKVANPLRVQLRANNRITSDVDPDFLLEYDDIYVGKPNRIDRNATSKYEITPHECRLRDMTYSAPVFVNLRYTKGKTIHVVKAVEICRLPIMLRSNKCHLDGVHPDEMSKKMECPLDPGGYFIVKGTEKVILVQEQLSKNRILVELDGRGAGVTVQASVTSSTHERKSKTYVICKYGRVLLRHNSLHEDVPIVVALKA